MFVFISISFLLLVAYGILIIYYHRAWNATPVYDPKLPGQDFPATKISIIIPVRNEENNLTRCIDSLSLQTYPKELYELILIDDHSTDRTWEIMTGLAGNELKITPIRLPAVTDAAGQIKAYKKLAIETGIQMSGGDLIITTDADCHFDPEWLQTISRFYTSTQAAFIAAPVKINATESLLSVFQTLDFITLQGITGASVFKQIHSMCNGANLAYEKKIFYEVDGFRDIDHIPSGDDMFLMHKIYTKYPRRVFFLKNEHAIVSTQPETTWRGFINQRIRWASKADKYDDKRITRVLVLVYAVNLSFLLLFIASFWNGRYLLVGLILLLLKTGIEYPFVSSVAGFFKQRKLMIYFPFFQPLHIVYTIVTGWLGKFGSYRWKDRKIK